MVAVDLNPCMVVSCADWNDGEPVRVQRVHRMHGWVAVCFQDLRCRRCACAVVVPLGMELDLVSGGCGGGQ